MAFLFNFVYVDWLKLIKVQFFIEATSVLVVSNEEGVFAISKNTVLYWKKRINDQKSGKTGSSIKSFKQDMVSYLFFTGAVVTVLFFKRIEPESVN